MYYRRRKSKKRLIVMFSGVLLFIALLYGYMSNNKPLERPENVEGKIHERKVAEENSKNNLIENTKEVDNQDIEERGNEGNENEGDEENNTIEDNNDNQDYTPLVTENTEIIFDTLYTQTGEIERNRVKAPVTLVGTDLSDFKEYIENNYSSWKIKNISTKSVALYREKEGLTPNTYILKDKDGYIVVYKINSSGKEELVEETDISTTNLPEADKAKLNKGMKVKTLDEVESLIQDYSS